MANTKISALTAIDGASLATGDLLVAVDVSDTSMASSGTTKKTTVSDVAAAVTALAEFLGLADVDVTGLADGDTFVFDAGTSKLVASTVLAPTAVFGQAQTINAQTGTTYTLVAGDVGKLVTLSNASAITLTVPQDSDATIAVGKYVDLMQLGAGQVTVVAGTGATLYTGGATAKARAQYSSLGVQKIATNTWRLFGDLAAT